MKSNLEKILDTAKDKIQGLIDQYIVWYKEDNEGNYPTKYDLEMYEIGLKIDFIKSFNNYILESDEICVHSVATSKGSLIFNLSVKREGQSYYFSNEMIIAGGHNIQCRHYRYIAHTTLHKIKQDNRFITELEQKRKRLTKQEKIKEDIEITKSNLVNQMKYYDGLIGMTDEEIFKKHYLDNERFNWDRLVQGAKDNYGTKEKFEQYVSEERKKELHKYRVTMPNLRSSIEKDFIKKIQKLEQKLEEI